MPGNATTATTTTANGSNASAAGGGPLAHPGSAPSLPDVVPDAVQSLVDGLFAFGGDLSRAFGEAVSGLAGAIGGSPAAHATIHHALHAGGMLS